MSLNRVKTILILLLFMSLILVPVVSQAQRAYVEGEVIVKLKNQASQQDTYAFMGKAQAAKGMSLKTSLPRMNMYHYSLKAGKSVEQMVEELKTDPNVEYVEPNYLFTKASLKEGIQAMSVEEIQALSGGDEDYPQTGANIRAMEVWGTFSGRSGRPPVVAVIDTGLDVNHEAFVETGAIWTNPDEIPENGIDDDGNGYVDDIHGWNFVHGSGTIIDDDGHGTHVSGIILGVGQSIVAPFTQSAIRIMPLKFLDNQGVGSTSDAISAIYYAIENGARVLNNSWGGPNYSAALHEAVAYSYNQGIVFVAAAGNTGTDNDYEPLYPASYEVPHMISIAATTEQDRLAHFSNFGVGSVDVGSPGVLIWSTIPNDSYGYSSGTSMAAPFVSGMAALMLIESPEMLGYQVKSIVFQEADHVGDLESKLSQEGRIDVAGTIRFAREVPVDSSQPEYNFTNGDREIASSLSVASCGTVNQTYNRLNGGGRSDGRGGKGPGVLRVLLFLSLLMVPVALVQWLRRRKFSGACQRKYERFKVDSEIKVKIDGQNLVGSISTISLGGVQLNTEALLEQGGIVTMSVTSPDGEEQVQVQGRVVWRKEQESYGVQFAKAEESTFKSLSRWGRSLAREES